MKYKFNHARKNSIDNPTFLLIALAFIVNKMAFERYLTFRKNKDKVVAFATTIIMAIPLAILITIATSMTTTAFPYIPSRMRLMSKPHETSTTLATTIGQPLVLYNKPPKTGSTTIRVAMSKAMAEKGIKSAHCFSMTEWNDMALRTIVHLHDIGFWGCHVRLFEPRFNTVASMRGGNVIFMTSTRDSGNIILSAYLQLHRARQDQIMALTDEKEIQAEVQQFEQFVDDYPIDALYNFHGASVPLKECPPRWPHTLAMRDIAERYQVVVDLERADESTVMVERVTGVRPDFGAWLNPRTTNDSHPVINALMQVNTSHRSCGNELVHSVLKQQFNIIKDRLMQNDCFDEATGSYELCEKVKLTTSSMQLRSRTERMAERERIKKLE